MRKKIMILGASILQLPAIEKAIEMGLEVIVVDMNPNSIGFEVPGVIKEVISTIDEPAILKAASKHKIDGIMTLATDMPMRSVALVAKELELVGIDKDTALKATNKAEMRMALNNYGVPIPKFYKVANEEEYFEAVKCFSGPFIVKPVDSSGSRGIYKVQNVNDYKQVREAYNYCKPFSRVGDVIVEEYMKGPEVSVETVSFNGECHVIQITDKVTTGEPHYVEIGHSQPTVMGETIAKEIKKIAIAANKAIGIDNGPSHTEIIVTEEGPKIVEIGARLGGDNINTHLVPLSTGVDIVEICIKIALGEAPVIEEKWNKGAAIRYLTQTPGIIKKIEGIEKAKQSQGIKQVSIVHGVGEKVTSIESSGARMGFVIAQDDTVEKAIKDCEEAIKKIEVTIQSDK